MTPSFKVSPRVRSSLFLKILLVFLGAFTSIIVYASVSYWYFDWERQRLSVQTTAINYAQFILEELGHPPDSSRAREVSEQLEIGVRIEGPGVDWASSQSFPTFDEVNLPEYEGMAMSRAGLTPSLGLSADVIHEDYRYLLALQAGGMAPGSSNTSEDIADVLFMMILLACVYLLTRRLLQPVRVLSDGVEQLRSGQLEVEMETRRTDELGRLVVSFNEMARTVRERIKARDQLLLDVSHEIRSPLTRMRVALEMTEDSKAKQSIIQDIEETEAMISELLETERLESEHGGLEYAPTDLSKLLEESAGSFRKKQHVDLELKGAEEPWFAELDAERIRVLVKNILSNAIKYSDPGGPPVQVVMDAREKGVVVSFHDHGVGISHEDLSYVFEPFYRADRSRSKETGGYGIGLGLAKRIAEAHGGSIELSSRSGQGTSVRVYLPKSRIYRTTSVSTSPDRYTDLSISS